MMRPVSRPLTSLLLTSLERTSLSWTSLSWTSLRMVLLLIGVPTVVAGQPSPRVPLGDPAYEQLDQIVGSGLVRTVIYGQRPYTQHEIVRLLADAATQARTRRVSESTARVLQQLSARFATAGDTSAAPTLRSLARVASAEVLVLDSPSRDIPPAPVGSVDAALNPLLNARAGRRFAQGPTLAAEIGGTWAIGRHLMVSVQPRLAAGGTSTGHFAEATLQHGTLALAARNVRVEVGRQAIAWGPAMDGGLMLSSSGRPLDMLHVSTEKPWRAPSVFRWLGLLRGSAFLADLGPRQNFPHAKIAAYKLSGQVTSYFELSAAVLAHEGGRGAPPTRLRDRFIDLVPALKYTLPDRTAQFSNKLAGWDMRVRIPMLHGLQLYTESVFDDMDPRRWRSTLWEDGGHIAGASLAQLGPGGKLSATGEFHHTGLRYYQHTPFTSGIAFNRTLLGDPLGPQGDGAYLRVRHDAGGVHSWFVDAAVERRGGDIWSTTSDGPREDRFRFVLQRHQPAEWRYRVAGQWTVAPTPAQRFTVQAGVERVRDAGFVYDARRTNALAGARWTWFAW